MGAVAYDPARVAVLYERALAVAAHLAVGRCRDPAAAEAATVSATLLAHLEERWLPTLREVMASDALLSWRAAATVTMPPGGWFDDLRPLRGQALGAALARRADDRRVDHYGELAEALAAASGDPAAMAAFAAALGPERLVEVAAELLGAAATTRADELAPALRDAFVAGAPGLPAGFGADLVRAAAAARHDRPSSPLAGAALGYLLRGGRLPGDLVVEAARALHEVEVAGGHDDGSGAEMWAQWAPPLVDPDLVPPPGERRGPSFGLTAVHDPVYGLLHQLAADGAAGRDVFGDTDLAGYYFARRPVTADGGRAVTAAAAAAAATDGVDAGAAPATIRDAMVVASSFVNGFGPAHAHDLLGPADDEVSTAVAAIVGRHLQSVQLTLVPGTGGAEQTGVVTSELESLGPDGPRRRAQFDPAALGATIDLAVNSAAGVAATRDWLTTYQATIAEAAVRRIAAGDIPAPRVTAFLHEVMQDAGRLEGAFASHVGHRAEAHGRDRDRELSFWVHGLGAAVKAGVGAAGNPYASAVVGQSVDPTADGFVDRLAHHQADAAEDAERWAQDATDRLLYLWDRQLCNQHVIRPDLPAGLLVGGQLPPYDDLEARLATVRANDPDPDHRSYDVRALFNAIDVAVGPSGVAVDDGALYDAVKAAQLDIYRHLD